ncbi:MAG: (d)CMP kinase [Verrucomicrobiota bacterium]|nr:(d)CMP kinase [Verrucomicrobiota bacterium]
MKKIQITIDGPAASGKSSVARLIAENLGGYYVNTGDMYRTLTLEIIRDDIEIKTGSQEISDLLCNCDIRYTKKNDNSLELMLNSEKVNYKNIRSPEVASHVSEVATLPEVREWMVERQRKSSSLGLIIMEGRDIGTVVFPNAAHKFYVTASPEERARRRLAQPGEVKEGSTVETVAKEIAMRDKIDSERKVAPLKPAEDAQIIDTTNMTLNDVVEKITNSITIL